MLQTATQKGMIIGAILTAVSTPMVAALMTEKDKLFEAADTGNIAEVRQLLANGLTGININTHDIDGATLLHAAASSGSAPLVEMLLEMGADVGAIDLQGAIPLHEAAIKGEIGIIKSLVDYGTDVDKPDNDGRTPLKAILYEWRRTRRDSKSTPENRLSRMQTLSDAARLLVKLGAKLEPNMHTLLSASDDGILLWTQLQATQQWEREQKRRIRETVLRYLPEQYDIPEDIAKLIDGYFP